MRNTVLLLVFSILFVSCSSSNTGKLGNFIKNDDSKNKVVFKKDSRLYLAELNPSLVEFYMQKSGSPAISSLKDIKWEKYLIEPNSNDSETEDFLDEFGLEENNYGFKSAKDFFASQYNEIFLKGMGGESLIISKFKPKSFNISAVDNLFLNTLKLSAKNIYSPKDSLNVAVYEPSDLTTFCQAFLTKYDDADFLIIIGQLYVTQDMFEGIMFGNDPLTGMQNISSMPKGTMIIPKVIVDVKNHRIAGYHIGRSIINPGAFSSVRTGIENSFINDTQEFNFFF